MKPKHNDTNAYAIKDPYDDQHNLITITTDSDTNSFIRQDQGHKVNQGTLPWATVAHEVFLNL